MSTKVKDLLERVAWTFVEAAGAVLLVTSQPLSKASLVAAVAAGVTAVKTLVKNNLE